MGKVTDAIVSLVSRQVEAHGLVVWLDPEQQYEAALGAVQRSGVRVERWSGSYFELRLRVESDLRGDEPSRLVVYLPLTEAVIAEPLCELLAAGALMKPGHASLPRNTRITVVARHALAATIADDALASALAQVEGRPTALAELDELAERGEHLLRGGLSLVFTDPSPVEVGLRFVARLVDDGVLNERKLVADLSRFLQDNFGLDVRPEWSAATLRDAFAAHALVRECDASAHIQDARSPSITEAMQDACIALARTWRNRRDVTDSYVASADRWERTLVVDWSAVPFENLERVETFRASELALVRSAEQSLADGSRVLDEAWLQQRIGGFWPYVEPEIRKRWELIRDARGVISSASEVRRGLRDRTATVAALVRSYTGGEAPNESSSSPWCLLDTHYRRLEQRFARDRDVGSPADSTERLVAGCRKAYLDATSDEVEAFVERFEAASWRIEGLPLQREVFERYVRPAIDEGRTAYLLVDGLRYEMMRELHAHWPHAESARLHCVLGVLPSITEIGMAALLPGASGSGALVQAGKGVALALDGKPLRNREERVRHLKASAGVADVVVASLHELLDVRDETRKRLREARFVALTATDELDGLCEGNNAPMARRLLEDVLDQVQRAVRALLRLGFRSVIVTADHGHLFGEALDSGRKLDPPGGQTVDLHRRVWIGRGGAADPAVVRIKSASLGFGGDLEIVIPRGLACFRSGGSVEYFHGGASPQELLVPVWVVRSDGSIPALASGVQWEIEPTRPKITTRFMTVRVRARALLPQAPTTVRLEVRDGKACVSRAVAAAYGFDEVSGAITLERTADGKFQENVVTLDVGDAKNGRAVDVVLLDDEGVRTLAIVRGVPVALAGF